MAYSTSMDLEVDAAEQRQGGPLVELTLVELAREQVGGGEIGRAHV